MKAAADVRTGNLLIIDGRIFKVEGVETKGAAKTQKSVNLRMKELVTGKYMENTFHQDDKLEEADVLTKKALYSYTDGDKFYFIDEESCDNYEIGRHSIGAKDIFLKENEKYDVLLQEGVGPLEVNFPERVKLKVVTAPPGIKQHDSSSTSKRVELENGAEIDVPQFVEEGDMVLVSTDTGKYVDRLKRE